jgi:hypothetical protein
MVGVGVGVLSAVDIDEVGVEVSVVISEIKELDGAAFALITFAMVPIPQKKKST